MPTRQNRGLSFGVCPATVVVDAPLGARAGFSAGTGRFPVETARKAPVERGIMWLHGSSVGVGRGRVKIPPPAGFKPLRSFQRPNFPP